MAKTGEAATYTRVHIRIPRGEVEQRRCGPSRLQQHSGKGEKVDRLRQRRHSPTKRKKVEMKRSATRVSEEEIHPLLQTAAPPPAHPPPWAALTEKHKPLHTESIDSYPHANVCTP